MMTPFRCLLTTVESDSHMWNLVYLQKLLEESGGQVRNLGPCTPVPEVLTAVAEFRPDLLVVSSVDGHGLHGARVLLQSLRWYGYHVPCVVGGKLTTAESNNNTVRAELLALGYIDVFTEDTSLGRFRDFLEFGRSNSFAAWQADTAVAAPWDTPVHSTVEVC